MFKKIFIILASIIFVVSCSNNTTKPGDNGGTTPGGGGEIPEDAKPVTPELLKPYIGKYYYDFDGEPKLLLLEITDKGDVLLNYDDKIENCKNTSTIKNNILVIDLKKTISTVYVFNLTSNGGTYKMIYYTDKNPLTDTDKIPGDSQGIKGLEKYAGIYTIGNQKLYIVDKTGRFGEYNTNNPNEIMDETLNVKLNGNIVKFKDPQMGGIQFIFNDNGMVMEAQAPNLIKQ